VSFLLRELWHNRSMTQKPLIAIILAAGSGTRMQSSLPKPLHKVAGRTLLDHVLASIAPLTPVQTVVVLAPNMEQVAQSLPQGIAVAYQHKPQGTGHAAQCGLNALPVDAVAQANILVAYGDMPLQRTENIERLLERMSQSDNPAVVVSGMHPKNPTGYGRLMTEGSTLLQIVEERDATEAQRSITLCNGAALLFDGSLLPTLLSNLTPNNVKQELYLTDTVALARSHSRTCGYAEVPAEDMQGVNTRAELAQCEKTMQDRLRHKFLDAGVGMIDPYHIYFAADTEIEPDVTIDPYVVIGEGVKIGKGSHILAFSHIENTIIGQDCRIGPHARLRDGCMLGNNINIGNFVELKNSQIGDGTKAQHLVYLGDAELGKHVNIGAGTITCNYDGFAKHKTTIGDGAFIGSNSALVAPLSVGKAALVGAGSTITGPVPDDTLALTRTPQQHAAGRGMASRRKERQ
jgi:bifunctional UDP-N-acetylglucosamine pyrophosphorylase/glucosamine-1-phosphate N-acetyltransferase